MIFKVGSERRISVVVKCNNVFEKRLAKFMKLLAELMRYNK